MILAYGGYDYCQVYAAYSLLLALPGNSCGSSAISIKTAVNRYFAAGSFTFGSRLITCITMAKKISR